MRTCGKGVRPVLRVCLRGYLHMEVCVYTLGLLLLHESVGSCVCEYLRVVPVIWEREEASPPVASTKS